MNRLEKIKTVAIDDDVYVREQLRDLLTKQFPQIELAALCSNATEGLESIRQWNPDLVFLDIEMPDMSGFQMLETIREIYFETVFITSFNQYAIKAIQFSALDYLLKPIKIEELKKALERFALKIASRSDAKARIGNFILNMQTRRQLDYHLAIPTTEGTFFLPTDDIRRLEAEVNYTQFILKNGKKVIASRTLKEYSGLLADHDFIRTHKSHLVNRKYVRMATSDHYLLMADDSKVEVSTRKWEEVKSALRNS